MSFQAYLENIQAKTGKTPEDFKKAGREGGGIQPDHESPRRRPGVRHE